MNVRFKITFTLLMTLIIYTITLGIIQKIHIKNTFDKSEFKAAQKDLDRVFVLLKKEQEKIEDLVYEYAVWDDSYSFMEIKNQNYLSTNYYDEYLNEKNLSYVVFFDIHKKVYYGKEKSKNNEWKEIVSSTEIPYPKEKSGIIKIGKIYYLYGSHHILMNNKLGKSRGTLVFFKKLDDSLKEIKELALDIEFYIQFYENKPMNFYVNKEYFSQYIKSNEILITQKSIYDEDGKSIGMIISQHDRDLNRAWKEFLKTTVITLIVALILFFFVASYILRIMISKPIGDLALSMKALKKDLNSNESIPYLEREDEIGSLANSFNELKLSVLEGNTEILRLNSFLESEVQNRTKDLIEINRQLMLSEKIILETSESICITDLNGLIIRVNKAFVKLSGYEEDELVGSTPNLLKSGRHNQKFYKEMWQSIINTGNWSGEIWDRKKNGEIYPKWMTVNTLYDDERKPIYYIAISSDITKIKNSEDKIKKLAYYDSLTSLPNRHLFTEILDKAIKRSLRKGKATVLMFLDLDRFKMINDNLGHSIGDLVLIEVSTRLKKIIKNSDTVARLGGDEFTLILEDIEYDMEIGPIAERIIQEISKTINIENKELNVGASIGIAYAPVDDFSVEGLLMKADSAMYQAKEAGKGQYAYYSRGLQQKNNSYLHLEQLLKDTIKNNKFISLIQPKVMHENESNYVVGGEILIRMKDEDGSLVSPESFIKVAEDTGLIIPLGNWIIEDACRVVSELQKLNIRAQIAVNASIKQFENNAIIHALTENIEKYNISPKNLEIEVTESLFRSDVSKIKESLQLIRNMGLSIAIDDFGTGYSSLSTIASLPIDTLKIDKAFTDQLLETTGSELISTIIGISKNLGLKTVIEGVETAAQIEKLRVYEPIIIQGYFYSKPIELVEFISFYKRMDSLSTNITK